MVNFSQILTYFVSLLLSLSFHEAAHAYMAKRQGDQTAALQGRLTLNPLAHVDIIGTIVFPLIFMLSGVPIIGWAKPVPIDPRCFKDQKWGELLVAAAGPVANLLLSFVSLVVFVLYYRFFHISLSQNSFFFPLIELSIAMIGVNAFLAVFNLLPLAPLDGSVVLRELLPLKQRLWYEANIAPYGSWILLVLFFTGGLRWVSMLAQTYIQVVYQFAQFFVT